MQTTAPTEKLIQFWREMDLTSGQYIHQKDKGAIDDELCYTYKGHESYLSLHDFHINEIGFHTNLLPVPYVGNIKTATIFLLLLNPGFGIQDYYAETSSEGFVEATRKNIRQEYMSNEYPFFLFDPKYIWHPGGQYWLKRLNDYILEVSFQKEMTYLQALSYVSAKIAVLELVPYHSKSFGQHNLINKLESVKQMQQYVADYLLQRANNKEIGIVCTRQSKAWGLEKSSNVIIYGKNHSRGAWLSFNSAASEVICRFLGIDAKPQSKMVRKKGKN